VKSQIYCIINLTIKRNYKNILQALGQILVLNLFILVGYGGGLDNTSLTVFFIILNLGYILIRFRGKKDDDSFSGNYKI
jgi:hypothetical protein